jgi:DNA polymerase III subunit delta'
LNSVVSFSSFVGNRRVVDILRRALGQGRLPHAMIFAGPAGVGKRTLALLLARQLNCQQPRDGEACDRCNSCRKIFAGAHPDVRTIEPDGAYIKVDQMRELIGEIAYQPFEGRMRVAILDGADQMRAEGANCILKTLEEPPSRSIFVLITPKPYLLLQTIRSRSRMLQFGLIEETAIEEFLVRIGERSRADAHMAAVVSNGSLGVALAFDVERNRETREQALRFITLLLRKGPFAQVSQLAAAIVKEKDLFVPWLDMTALLLQDVYYSQVAPDRVGQRDIAAELSTLAKSASRPAVVAAIQSVKYLKASLQFNVNRQLALEALFL